MSDIVLGTGNLHILNTYLPEKMRPGRLYHVLCEEGVIKQVLDADSTTNVKDLRSDAAVLDVNGEGILIPALCHAHIHLDKCFILDQCDELVHCNFQEALTVTEKAKRQFPDNEDDLYDRGKRLILESVHYGVTSMRVHVEVDETVGLTCFNVGLRLKEELAKLCDIQITVFAQNPLIGDLSPLHNYTVLENAATDQGVSAVGSAPYVESSVSRAKSNIDLVLDLACRTSIHADFHLDYNLNQDSEPLIWYILSSLVDRIKSEQWKPHMHVCIGHATRLTLFTPEEWHRLRSFICEHQLPVTLVGLPQSDLYMMGRDMKPFTPRGTLNIPKLAGDYGINAAMSVNNVGNAFTPQGSPDPLSLCPLGVAMFQTCTVEACEALLESVTTVSRKAIGNFKTGGANQNLMPTPGDSADFVVLHGSNSLQSVILNPSPSRTVIKRGSVIATSVMQKWCMIDGVLPLHKDSI